MTANKTSNGEIDVQTGSTADDGRLLIGHFDAGTSAPFTPAIAATTSTAGNADGQQSGSPARS